MQQSKFDVTIKTHSGVSAAMKDAQAHQCAIYTTGQVADFSLSITQQLQNLFLPNHITMSSYTVPYVPNLKEIAPAVPEIQVPETCQIFFISIFFFLAPNNKSLHKLYSCIPISTKFGAQVALPKPYISTKFGTICSKMRKI